MRRPEYIPPESHLLILLWIAGIGLLFAAPGIGVGVIAGAAGCAYVRARRVQSQEARLLLAHARTRALPTPRARLRGRTPPVATPVVVPVVPDHESREALVPFAHLLGGPDDPVHVVRVRKSPPQSSWWPFREDEPQVLAQFSRVSDAQLPCSFEGPHAQHSAELLHERASEPHTRWVVMGWQATSRWKHAFDLLTRVLDHPPCPVLVVRAARTGDPLVDRTPSRPRRILVLATRRPGDATLLHLASRVAASSGTDTISVAYLAPLEATTGDLHRIRSYHESLAPPELRSRVEIVRSSDPLDALAGLTRRFEILILGREGGEGLRSWVQEPFADRLARTASCAVLQLRAEGKLLELDAEHGQSPRAHAVLDLVEVVRGESTTPHRAWFRRIELRLAEELGNPGGSFWEQAVWEVEQLAHPGPSVGATALYWASIPGLERIHLGLWVLRPRAGCESPGSERRDLCFALIGPPSQEPAMLALLERLRHLSTSAPGVLALCAAETLSDAKAAIHTTEQGMSRE
jgi:nucleotide-binding universal stress UspA family protein